MGRLAGLVLLCAAPFCVAAGEFGLSAGRATDSQDTDVVRLTYRRALSADGRAWWWPQQVQVGFGIWRLPDLGGRTRRYDASVTPVWRAETRFGYVEGGIGAYVLSHTINNRIHRLPTALQFGSHLGVGVALGEAGSIGLAVQHLSNAGIKEPNGGINFYMATLGFRL
jgi:hypothetical protein